MKLSETGEILTLIALNYPKFEVTEDKARLWFDLIGDLPFKLAQMALKKVMLTSQFPPTVADIRKAAVEIITPASETLDAGKAWGEVQKAIRKCGWCDPEGAYKLMSPLTKQVVDQMSWKEICGCEELGVMRGQFMKMFNTLADRQKEQRLLPEKFRKQIAGIDLKKISSGDDINGNHHEQKS